MLTIVISPSQNLQKHYFAVVPLPDLQAAPSAKGPLWRPPEEDPRPAPLLPVRRRRFPTLVGSPHGRGGGGGRDGARGAVLHGPGGKRKKGKIFLKKIIQERFRIVLAKKSKASK